MTAFEISSKNISLDTLNEIFSTKNKIKLSDEVVEKVNKCRDYIDKKIDSSDFPIYGINTGFGSLYNVSIDKKDLSKLQENLILSHSCGLGDIVPVEISKMILFLKIQSLSYGHSGISLEIIQRLVEMYNLDIIPVIYNKGSLGASGDLAPLAHLSLPLINKGKVYFEGEIFDSIQINKKFNFNKIELRSKEGLALLNGTQFMLGYSLYIALETRKIIEKLNYISALSIDAFDGRIEPFNDLISKIRPHNGHRKVSDSIRDILKDSQLINQTKTHVQDPYSFRCIPQVHGASYDAIEYCFSVIHTEINSVTDNPNVFVDEDLILSAGNFHGQPLAIMLDFLSLALHELGSISERRTYLLLSGQRNLPTYLVANPGLNSGFMIAQYSAAALVSQNKQLCTPASADSIVSSNGQEDHVSMGANGATKCLTILNNLKDILSIEALCAAQAYNFRAPLLTSKLLQNFHSEFRKYCPFIENDVIVADLINSSKIALFGKS